jgi:hypothetical protein
MQTFPMKRSITLNKTLIVVALILFGASCKKGDTGPAGAAGPAGTANVLYSAWFTPPSWTKDTVFGIWGYKYSKSFAEITQAVVDSGTVLTFGRLTGYNASIWAANTVAPLPINLTYIQGTTMTDTWTAKSTVGSVQIRFVNDKNYWTSIATSHSFRVIIIPGGKAVASTADGQRVFTRNGRVLGAETYNANMQEVARNWKSMSYAEVCEKLGIEE